MKKFVDESWLVLLMGVVFALMLAGTQVSLSQKIEDNRQAELEDAIAQVVPDLATTEPLQVDGRDVYKCFSKEGKHIGWAVKASGTGFIDKITLVVGVSADRGTVLGIRVVEHLETPGLGNKIESKDGNKFPAQFAGKRVGQELKVVKRPVQADDEIQAITGATYSSGYTTDIVNDVMENVVPKLPRN